MPRAEGERRRPFRADRFAATNTACGLRGVFVTIAVSILLAAAIATASARALTQDNQLPADASALECGPCADGQYVVSECDGESGVGRVCGECTERCGEGVEECASDGRGDALCSRCNFPGSRLPVFLSDPDGDGLGECKFCSFCRYGQYLAAPCTDTADTMCVACSQCGDDEVEVEACGDSSDTVCEPLGLDDADSQQHVNITADDTEDAFMGGNSSGPTAWEGEADNITAFDALDDEANITAIDANSTDDAMNTTEAEPSDTWVEADTNTTGNATESEELPTKDFDEEGDFLQKPTILDQEAGGVSAMSGENAADNSTATEPLVDTVDKLCGPCPEGQYVSEDCNEEDGTPRTCMPCSDRCGEGIMECMAIGNGDALCKECNFGPEIYLDIDSETGFGECKFCSKCRQGMYLRTPCTEAKDNVCESCRSGQAGTPVCLSLKPLPLNFAELHSVCADGEVELNPCSSSQDTVCAPAAPADVVLDIDARNSSQIQSEVDTLTQKDSSSVASIPPLISNETYVSNNDIDGMMITFTDSSVQPRPLLAPRLSIEGTDGVLPSSIAFGSVVKPIMEGATSTVFYRLYTTDRMAELETDPPTVDCFDPVIRSFDPMHVDGVAITSSCIIVAFQCREGERNRSPLFVQSLKVELAHIFTSPGDCEQCTLPADSNSGFTVTSRIGRQEDNLATKLDALPLLPPAGNAQYLRVVHLTKADSDISILTAGSQISAQSDVRSASNVWHSGLTANDATAYKRVPDDSEMLFYSGTQLLDRIGLPLSEFNVENATRFFTILLIDGKAVLLEDAPLMVPLGGVLLRLISRSTWAPQTFMAAESNSSDGKWQKGKPLKTMDVGSIADLCLQGERPCRARHYEFTLNDVKAAQDGIALIAEEGADQHWFFRLPYTSDEAVTVVLPPKGGEAAVIRNDFAGTLLLGPNAYLSLDQDESMDTCAAEATMKVMSPMVVRSSVCNSTAAEAAPPLYKVFRRALSAPLISSARHYIPAGPESSSAVLDGTMDVTASILAGNGAYIVLTTSSEIGPSLSCDTNLNGVVSTKNANVKNMVQASLSIGVSQIWAVACPLSVDNDASSVATSRTVVLLPVTESPLKDTEALVHMELKLRAPRGAQSNTHLIESIESSVEDVLGYGGAVITSFDEVLTRRALKQSVDQQQYSTYVVALAVVVPSSEVKQAKASLQGAADVGGPLDDGLRKYDMALVNAVEEVTYQCSERESLNCQMSDWEWSCGTTATANICWANRSALVLFSAGICGMPCGNTFESTTVPCRQLPPVCVIPDVVDAVPISTASDETNRSSNSYAYIAAVVCVIVIAAVILGTVMIIRRRRRSSTGNANTGTANLQQDVDNSWDSDDRTHA